MSKSQFIKNMCCDNCYRKVIDIIDNDSIDKVLELYEYHKSFVRNHRYKDLETHFNMRLNK